MKITKLFSAIAVLAFLVTSCSNDDGSPIRPDGGSDQTEVGKELTFEGTYEYGHSGMPIPFEFAKKTITMKMSEMAGSGQDDDLYNILTVYKNKEGVLKVVAKNAAKSEYSAFFIKNISDKSVDFNMDYSFSNEKEAIDSTYPTEGQNAPDHSNMKFGWLTLYKAGESETKITLPVNGKYVFSSQGHSYYYDFSNEVINFNGSYDMTVLAHNTSTNKILLQGADESVAGKYYVAQLKNITENSVDVARLTFSGDNAKTEAESEFAKSEEVGANFSTYTREGDSSESSFENLNGTYGSAIIYDENNEPLAQYVFKIGENNEAFLFRANMTGSGMDDFASFVLSRVFADESKGQLIYKITSSTGYYAGREGQFLTIYVKDISATADKATFAIATKDGSTSVAASKGDVIGKTLEEAKEIQAPSADKIWNLDMMTYAHQWISTTKE